jgi:hypothetical protein
MHSKETQVMTAAVKVLAVCSLLMAPIVASAQSSDAGYCRALTEAYRNSVTTTADPNAIVPVAISKCAAGDTAAGIPVLEQALRQAKVDLPSRR